MTSSTLPSPTEFALAANAAPIVNLSVMMVVDRDIGIMCFVNAHTLNPITTWSLPGDEIFEEALEFIDVYMDLRGLVWVTYDELEEMRDKLDGGE